MSLKQKQTGMQNKSGNKFMGRELITANNDGNEMLRIASKVNDGEPTARPQVKANVDGVISKYVQEKPTFRQKVEALADKNNVITAAEKEATEEILGLEMGFDDLLRISAGFEVDASIKCLEASLMKDAVDQAAKDYWQDYFGEYGKCLTEDYKELAKGKKASIAMALNMADYYSRTFGRKSAAVQVIACAIDERLNGAK